MQWLKGGGSHPIANGLLTIRLEALKPDKMFNNWKSLETLNKVLTNGLNVHVTIFYLMITSMYCTIDI